MSIAEKRCPAMTTISLSLDRVDELTMRALTANNASAPNARSVSDSVVAAEADGIHSHGLARLPTYCEHAKCGKVDGNAIPTCQRVGTSALRVDAREGFAHPAIDLGLGQLVDVVRETGIAGMSVVNSYNCGVVGYHVERIANHQLVALGCVNAPASIAPWGGRRRCLAPIRSPARRRARVGRRWWSTSLRVSSPWAR